MFDFLSINIMNQIVIEKWESSSMVNYSILEYLTPYRIISNVHGEYTGDRALMFSNLGDHLKRCKRPEMIT